MTLNYLESRIIAVILRYFAKTSFEASYVTVHVEAIAMSATKSQRI